MAADFRAAGGLFAFILILSITSCQIVLSLEFVRTISMYVIKGWLHHGSTAVVSYLQPQQPESFYFGSLKDDGYASSAYFLKSLNSV
jgi:hypothetical protein